MNNNKKHIVWKTNVAKVKIASVRYRCLLPALFLENLGYKSVVIEGDEDINAFEKCLALVFVKTFSQSDYELALKATRNNIPIILDLCDDIFVKNYSNANNFVYFDQMANLADCIVTTGNELADLVRTHTKVENVIVIADQVESLSLVNRANKRLKTWRAKRYLLNNIWGKIKLFSQTIIKLLILIKNIRHIRTHYRNLYFLLGTYKKNLKEKFLHSKTTTVNLKQKTRKRIVWFGNHGAAHSNFGMTCLLDVENYLVNINKKVPLELLVISNNYSKYEKFIKPFPIDTLYKKWDSVTIFDEISQCDVCIVPSSQDDFSKCKSPNRSLLALSLGIPVVATRIPALDELSSCVILDDWENGLFTYLTDSDKVKKDINLAHTIIESKFSGPVIAKLWDTLLKDISK